MQKLLKIIGFLMAGFGLLILLKGAGIVPGIIFTLIGSFIIIFSTFSSDFSKKRARKELMELKALLDNGVINEAEYEKKSEALKNKI